VTTRQFSLGVEATSPIPRRHWPVVGQFGATVSAPRAGREICRQTFDEREAVFNSAGRKFQGFVHDGVGESRGIQLADVLPFVTLDDVRGGIPSVIWYA